MKKLFIILLVFFAVGCINTEPTEYTTIPLEVQNTLITSDSTDLQQVFVIETEQNRYYFNTDKQLEYKYTIDDNTAEIHGAILSIFLILIILLGVVIGGMIFS